VKVLKEARLVTSRREGNRCIYRIDIDGVGALRAYLDQFCDGPLAAYKAAIDERREGIR
jgi:DNA-binding transcriptional ArsR family regulator